MLPTVMETEALSARRNELTTTIPAVDQAAIAAAASVATSNTAAAGKELGGKKKSLFRTASSSLLGGMRRKTASSENDVIARVMHLSGMEASDNTGMNPKPFNKKNVPKMKYKESDVKQMMRMGFTKDQSVQALIENSNDMEQAISALLSAHK